MVSYLNYIRFLAEADGQVNTHSTHVEEKFILDGPKGLDASVEGLRCIVDEIGRGEIPAVSTKIDGIALFFGWTDKGFFVSNKSLFNKTPKIAYSNDEIKANWKADLFPMMSAALEYLPKVCPKDKCVYQGDFLFSNRTLKSVKVAGVDSWAWHPNIIEYTVSKTSAIGKSVAKAKMGIVVHTRYTWDGINPKTLGVAEFGISKKNFKNSKDVFLIDTISNLSAQNGDVGFAKGDWDEIGSLLKDALAMKSKIDWDLLKDSGFSALLLPYYNTFVKSGVIPPVAARVEGFKAHVQEKMEKAVASRKTEKGQAAQRALYEPYLDVPAKSLESIFLTMDMLTKVKLMVLDQLNRYALYKNFVVTRGGDYISPKDEGFVIVKSAGRGLKLVDRLEFSRNNFSKDIVSGFDKDEFQLV